MKLLINLCAHDGIISHYAGVGTIVRRYVEVIRKILSEKNINYHLNLFTLEFNEKSMGYNKELWDYHASLENTSLYILSNGTNGETSFGNIENWLISSKNVSNKINEINFSDYDYVLNVCNDTPFAYLTTLIKTEKNSVTVWIPHSTGKIYNEDMSLSNEKLTINERVKMEQDVIDYINNHNNTYAISTSIYIRNHLFNSYGLIKTKTIDLINGELLFRNNLYVENKRIYEIFKEVNNYDSIILSLGRAERYKNLDKTMLLGNQLKIKPIVITQQYFAGQPIIKEYEELAKKTNSLLFVDEPFFLPQYIVKNYNKPMILLVPSEREIFGLVINEMRRFNKNNVLIVANDRGGLHEQISDGIDGVLVDLNDIDGSANKIRKYFDEKTIRKMNVESQKKLKNNYDLEKNFDAFFKKVLGDNYE